MSLSEGKKESRVSSSGYCRRRAFHHQKTPAGALNSSRVQELLHPKSRRGQAPKRSQSIKVKVKDISNSRFCAKLTEAQRINIIQRLLDSAVEPAGFEPERHPRTSNTNVFGSGMNFIINNEFRAWARNSTNKLFFSSRLNKLNKQTALKGQHSFMPLTLFICGGPCHLLSGFQQWPGDLIFLWEQLVSSLIGNMNTSQFELLTHSNCKHYNSEFEFLLQDHKVHL